MENRTNYHSHCSFCDGHAPMEDFVCAAIREGFTAYGISSHAPLPYSTRWTMERRDVPAYLAEFRRLKQKYEGKIELYVGLEIDYLDEGWNPSVPFFRALPLDYRIASLEACNPEEIFSSEITEILRKTLASLPEQTRRIFILSRFEQKSVKEISELMHLAPKSVEYHITKSLKALRVALKDYLPIFYLLFYTH